jgi:hypothetical protein
MKSIMDMRTGSLSTTKQFFSKRGSRTNLAPIESARSTFIPQSQNSFFNQSQSAEAREDGCAIFPPLRTAVKPSQTIARNLGSIDCQEMSSPSTAERQEMSRRPSTAEHQEMSSRPSTATRQEMSSRPSTAAISLKSRSVNLPDNLVASVSTTIHDRSIRSESRDSIATVTSREPQTRTRMYRQHANRIPCEEKSGEHSPRETETVPVTVETVPVYCREEAAARFQLQSKATSKELFRTAASSAWEKSSNQKKFIELISANVTATPQVFHQLQAVQFLYPDVQPLDIAQEALDKLNSFRHVLGVQK